MKRSYVNAGSLAYPSPAAVAAAAIVLGSSTNIQGPGFLTERHTGEQHNPIQTPDLVLGHQYLHGRDQNISQISHPRGQTDPQDPTILNAQGKLDISWAVGTFPWWFAKEVKAIDEMMLFPADRAILLDPETVYDLMQRRELVQVSGCACASAARGPASKFCSCGMKFYTFALVLRLYWNLQTGTVERPGRIPSAYMSPLVEEKHLTKLFDSMRQAGANCADCQPPNASRIVCTCGLTEFEARKLMGWLRTIINERSDQEVCVFDQAIEEIRRSQERIELVQRKNLYDFGHCTVCYQDPDAYVQGCLVCICEADESYSKAVKAAANRKARQQQAALQALFDRLKTSPVYSGRQKSHSTEGSCSSPVDSGRQRSHTT